MFERGTLRRGPRSGTVRAVSEPLIEREEVVALLFAVSDINVTLVKIKRLLRGDDDEAEEVD